MLSDYPELNRYDTIDKVIASLTNINREDVVSRYSEIVLVNIKIAKELKYSIEIMDYLLNKNVMIYLSSNTPLDILKEIIKCRGWNKYFNEIYGYPSKKDDSLKNIIKNNQFSNEEYLVVGDGKGDESSANINGVDFFKVNKKSLKDFADFLNIEIST